MVGGEPYTKLALELRIRQILHDSTLGVELEAAETDLLRDLLARHPESDQKAGAGIRAFRTTTSKYGNRCFEVLRVDGTSAEFSYLKCLRKKKGEARGH
jgi:hypothetical protein